MTPIDGVECNLVRLRMIYTLPRGVEGLPDLHVHVLARDHDSFRNPIDGVECILALSQLYSSFTLGPLYFLICRSTYWLETMTF